MLYTILGAQLVIERFARKIKTSLHNQIFKNLHQKCLLQNIFVRRNDKHRNRYDKNIHFA